MKFKAVIFDLDGTLLNTLGDLRNAVNYALSCFGLPARTTDEVRMFIGNGVRNLIVRAMPEGASEDDIAKALGYFREYYNSHMNVETCPYEGIIDMLTSLRGSGVKVCINSNKYDAALKELCAHHFNGLYIQAEGESATCPRKPDPSAALMLAGKCGIEPDEMAYIGDSNVDIRTACNAGMTPIYVSWGFRTREDMGDELPELCFDSAKELTEYILR